MARLSQDITDRSFGHLVAISGPVYARVGNRFNAAFWECKCRCGKTKLIRASSLVNGRTKSCGCQQGSKSEAKP